MSVAAAQNVANEAAKILASLGMAKGKVRTGEAAVINASVDGVKDVVQEVRKRKRKAAKGYCRGKDKRGTFRGHHKKARKCVTVKDMLEKYTAFPANRSAAAKKAAATRKKNKAAKKSD